MTNKPLNKELRLSVVGAGKLIVGFVENGYSICGKAKGASVGVTWGRSGEAGGVIDRADLIILADEINKWIEANP